MIFYSFPGGSCWAPRYPGEANSSPLTCLSYLAVLWRRNFGAKGMAMHVHRHLQVGSSNGPSASMAERGEPRSSSGERFSHLHLQSVFFCSQQCPFSAQGNIWCQSTSCCKSCQHRAAEIRPARQTGCPHSALRDSPFASQDHKSSPGRQQECQAFATLKPLLRRAEASRRRNKTKSPQLCSAVG